MTDAEKKMKKYMNAVERRLNMPRELRSRVMSDLQSSVAARREAGQSDAEIFADLGSPRLAAQELNEQMKEFTYRKSPWRFLFLALAAVSGLWLVLYLAVQAAILGALSQSLGQAGSIGIIGGADGPTSIFLTTQVGMDGDLLLAGALLAAGILGFLRLRKCKK